MGDATKIEWTEATWNPIRGCTRVSEGCRNCYAERVAARFNGPGQPYHGLVERTAKGARWTGKVMLVESVLDQPLRWAWPRMIFVNSMSDLFHEAVPDEWIDRIFAVMAMAPQHTFQVLTKRPERMRSYLEHARARCRSWRSPFGSGRVFDPFAPGSPLPLPNVWLGVSAEDQATADKRVLALLLTPASVRFVSAEPLIGPIDFRAIRWSDVAAMDALTGEVRQGSLPPLVPWPGRFLDWIIVGGESGPGARPMLPDWARSIRDQCAAAHVPFFFKQWGEFAPPSYARVDSSGREWVEFRDMHRVGKARAGRLLDGAEHNGMPSVREVPR